MPQILHIETSTPICSAAISNSNGTIAYREYFVDKSHAAILTTLISEVLKEAKTEISKLKAVSISKGPGSYTGLRIGVSTAKGICYAAKKPLISCDTMQTIARMAKDKLSDDNANILYIPMIDARRMEVYTAIFNQQLEEIEPVSAKIIDSNSFNNLPENSKLIFCGNGAEKCKDIIQHPDAVFIENIFPSARFMGYQSALKLQNNDFENIAYFEPFYLKDFIATIPKNKVLGQK